MDKLCDPDASTVTHHFGLREAKVKNPTVTCGFSSLKRAYFSDSSESSKCFETFFLLLSGSFTETQSFCPGNKRLTSSFS